MLSDFKLEPRTEQHYLSIMVNMPSHEVRLVPPRLRDEVFAWLDANKIAAEGMPFLRYRVINLEQQWLRIEVGVPVVGGVEGNDRVQPGSFPPGVYATAIFIGDTRGPGMLQATDEFMVWAQRQGLRWKTWDSEEGHVWASRAEFDLTDAAERCDPEQHRTKLVFLTDGRRFA
jgi:hypothetical protein